MLRTLWVVVNYLNLGFAVETCYKKYVVNGLCDTDFLEDFLVVRRIMVVCCVYLSLLLYVRVVRADGE